MTRIEVIDSFEQFEALRDAWNDLAHRDGPPLPYLRHEWLASWWRGFGGEATLAIHVARDGSTLTAAAPLMRSRRSLAGVPVQALHSLGLNVGFADLLRDPARAGDLELLLRAALGDAHSDVVLARGTLAGSPKEAWMQAWLETERVAYETVRQGEFFLDTSRGVDDYRAARPSGLRHESDRRARQLAGRGEVRYERVSDSGAWEAALAEAFAVSLPELEGSGRERHRAAAFVPDLPLRAGAAIRDDRRGRALPASSRGPGDRVPDGRERPRHLRRSRDRLR